MFKVKPIEFGYYIEMTINEDIVCRFVSGIIKYLGIEFDDFNSKLKSYEGGYLELAHYRFGYPVKCIFFLDKKDAEKFIAEYLEPQLIIKELS